MNIPGPDFKTPLILAVQNPELITIVDNLLDYEADPFIGDQEGLNAIDHVANAEMRQMLINYVDQTRAKHESNTRSSDNHSFDDFEDEENQTSRVLVQDQEIETEVPPILSHQAPVNISDLSSWESSKDEDLFPEEPVNQKSLGNLKHSPGLMNLSKFIESDGDDEDNLEKVEVPKPQVDYPQEKIYDSVENIPDQDDENRIPSEPDRILEAIADYDTGDESDWDDSPRLPEGTVTQI